MCGWCCESTWYVVAKAMRAGVRQDAESEMHYCAADISTAAQGRPNQKQKVEEVIKGLRERFLIQSLHAQDLRGRIKIK